MNSNTDKVWIRGEQFNKKEKGVKFAIMGGGVCIWAEHMLCFKITSFVSHWTLTTCSKMNTESQRVDCKQSQLGGDNPEIWLRLWGSGPGSQDKLFFPWNAVEEGQGQVKPWKVCRDLWRSVVAGEEEMHAGAWKKIKQRTSGCHGDIICVFKGAEICFWWVPDFWAKRDHEQRGPRTQPVLSLREQL